MLSFVLAVEIFQRYPMSFTSDGHWWKSQLKSKLFILFWIEQGRFGATVHHWLVCVGEIFPNFSEYTKCFFLWLLLTLGHIFLSQCQPKPKKKQFAPMVDTGTYCPVPMSTKAIKKNNLPQWLTLGHIVLSQCQPHCLFLVRFSQGQEVRENLLKGFKGRSKNLRKFWPGEWL